MVNGLRHRNKVLAAPLAPFEVAVSSGNFSRQKVNGGLAPDELEPWSRPIRVTESLLVSLVSG